MDLAAWGLLVTLDEEAEENAERRAKGLPPLPRLKGPRKAPADTVTINVGGQKRQMPTPPPGAFYDGQGNLIRPQGATRRL